jgi:hypothetical protein
MLHLSAYTTFTIAVQHNLQKAMLRAADGNRRIFVVDGFPAAPVHLSAWRRAMGVSSTSPPPTALVFECTADECARRLKKRFGTSCFFSCLLLFCFCHSFVC